MRCWETGDANAVVHAFADPGLAHQTDRPISDVEGASEWIAQRRADWTDGTGYSWAVIDDSSRLLGSVTVAALDRRHSTGWVSYWSVQEFRGGGNIASALRAMAQWAFDDLELFRLELGHRTNNPASCYVARAAGFAVEGLERQKLRYGDERFDVELHARLATDVVAESPTGARR